MFKNKTILVTGGTGSFGKKFVNTILKNINQKRLLFLVEMNKSNFSCSNLFKINILLD